MEIKPHFKHSNNCKQYKKKCNLCGLDRIKRMAMWSKKDSNEEMGLN